MADINLTIMPETEFLLPAKAKCDGEEVTAIRIGLKASDASCVRLLAEIAAEKRAKYHLPTHLSDTEIFSGEESRAHQ